MSKRDYHDLPRAELLRKAEEVRRDLSVKGIKVEIFFKFTCRYCGERCTFKDANSLHARGECHVCGKETTVRKGGFMTQMIMF